MPELKSLLSEKLNEIVIELKLENVDKQSFAIYGAVLQLKQDLLSANTSKNPPFATNRNSVLDTLINQIDFLFYRKDLSNAQKDVLIQQTLINAYCSIRRSAFGSQSGWGPGSRLGDALERIYNEVMITTIAHTHLTHQMTHNAPTPNLITSLLEKKSGPEKALFEVDRALLDIKVTNNRDLLDALRMQIVMLKIENQPGKLNELLQETYAKAKATDGLMDKLFSEAFSTQLAKIYKTVFAKNIDSKEPSIKPTPQR